MALIVACVESPALPLPPEIDLPHFGIMSKAWSALGKIPDLGELLAGYQDQLAIALAPVRRFLEIVEVIMSLVNCVTAVPRAIIRLSPSPVFDCMEELVETVQRIIAWIPPFSYIRLQLGLMGYAIDLIDEIISFFTALDNRITVLIESMDLAVSLGDLELVKIVNCGISPLRNNTVVALDLMVFISPLVNVLMGVFLRLIPTPAMQKASDEALAAGAYLITAVDALRTGSGQEPLPAFPGADEATDLIQNTLVPVPPLAPVLASMNQSRSAMVILYNILANMVGVDADKTPRSTPTFNNF